MAQLQNNRKITISSAGSRKSTLWPSQDLMWSEFIEKLRVPVRGQETLAEYSKLVKASQDELKDVGSFVGGTLRDNRRKATHVINRHLVTLDLDNIPTSGTDDVLKRVEGLGCAYVAYSTRKHSDYKPRLRIVLPLHVEVEADKYEPIARKVADIIGINFADPTTFQAERLMYWPSASSDSQFVFQFADKPFLDGEAALGMYQDWRNVSEWPHVQGEDQKQVKLAAKQGNPLERPGIVGVFNRQYDIYSAIDKFIPGIYAPTDVDSRLTYLEGSTSGGAVVYQDGMYLYSHHATDPCSQKLVNAFDLIRLHKFHELDDDAKAETPINKMPSFLAMAKFAKADGKVAEAMQVESHERLLADFKLTESDKSWFQQLAFDEDNKLLPYESNVAWIVGNEFNGVFKADDFSKKVYVLKELPWSNKPVPREYTDADAAELAAYIQTKYRIANQSPRKEGIKIAISRTVVDEAIEWADSIPVWDGTHWDGVSIDSAFIKFLGVPDDAYHRAVSRITFMAIYARAKYPGIKYDNMVILAGKGNVGKSTFIKNLSPREDWFSDSTTSFTGDDAATNIQGILISETPEWDLLDRKDKKALKGFISKKSDRFRAKYGTHAKDHPRRGVYFATSNESNLLVDKTNRKLLVMHVDDSKSTFRNDDLIKYMPQLMAEAKALFKGDKSLRLPEDVLLRAKEVERNSMEIDPWEGIIFDFLEKKIPENYNSLDVSMRRSFYSDGEGFTFEGSLIDRDEVCALEVWEVCFNGHKAMSQRDARRINAHIRSLPNWETSTLRLKPYKQQRGFRKV